MVPEIWSTTDRIFCHFGPFFLPFYHTNNPENQSLEKMKKMPGDIIILYMCTKNYDHMIMVPEIWSATDRFFCCFGLFFFLLPPNDPENQKF